MVTGGFSPGVKLPGLEADHSPPSIAEVKNNGAIHPLNYLSKGVKLPHTIYLLITMTGCIL
jgi:hypothetical protein